jgi:hypothetical protein
MHIVKRVAVVLLMVVGVMAVSQRALQAHKGHDHMVMGTLTMVATDHVMVKVTDPKTKQESVKTIALKPTTKLLKGTPGTPAKNADLTVGTRVVVNIGEAKEPLAAKEIHIANAPAPGTR